MRQKTQYLKEEEIEAAVQELLRGYGSKYGPIISPPIPVEEMPECYLELDFRLDDLADLYGTPDVLGATSISGRTIAIDESLDPTIDPSKEGRYRFTVSHEIGHWELHRHLFPVPSYESPYTGETGTIVCQSNTGGSLEWQANCFAGHLLMPTNMVYETWEAIYGSRDSYYAVDEISDICARRGTKWGSFPTVCISREMASEFNVSAQAMQIRLDRLGLIQTKEDCPGWLAD